MSMITHVFFMSMKRLRLMSLTIDRFKTVLSVAVAHYIHLSVPLSTALTMESCRMFRLNGQITLLQSNWWNNSGVYCSDVFNDL